MRIFHSYAIESRKGSSGAVASITGGTLRIYGWNTLTSNPDTNTHVFLSDLNLSGNVCGPWVVTLPVYGTVSGRNFTLTHDNINWGSVPASDVNAHLYVLWGGSDATSRLVLIDDVTAYRTATWAVSSLGIGRF